MHIFSPHPFLNSGWENCYWSLSSIYCVWRHHSSIRCFSVEVYKEAYGACHESTPCQNTSVVLSDVALHLKRLVKLSCIYTLFEGIILYSSNWCCSVSEEACGANHVSTASLAPSGVTLNVSEEAYGACPVFTLCLKALIVPLGVTLSEEACWACHVLYTAWRHL